MRGFAYLYTLIIISLIIISATYYIVLRSNNISNNIYDFRQPNPVQIYNIIPLTYKIVENSTIRIKDVLLDNRLYKWTAGGIKNIKIPSEYIESFHGYNLKRAFDIYSKFMNNALNSYTNTDTLVEPKNITNIIFQIKYAYKSVSGDLTCLEVVVPNKISFLIKGSYTNRDQYAEYIIPFQYTVNSSIKPLIGSLSSYDIAFNVTLNIHIHIGNYSVPIVYDKVEAWLLKNIEHSTRYVIVSEIPVEINLIENNSINFLVTTKIPIEAVPILVKITLQNSIVSYLLIVLMHVEV